MEFIFNVWNYFLAHFWWIMFFLLAGVLVFATVRMVAMREKTEKMQKRFQQIKQDNEAIKEKIEELRNLNIFTGRPNRKKK